jgi:molybdopterin-binding protein
MNRVQGRILRVEASDEVSLVDVETGGGVISAVILETPESLEYMGLGAEVYVLFKETEVALGLDAGKMSYLNVFDGKILGVRCGRVLAEVVVWTAAGEIVSIITKRSFDRLGLKEGARVKAVIKSTEVALEGLGVPS